MLLLALHAASCAAVSEPASFDCQVRLLALAYAKKALDGADVTTVAEDLGLTKPEAARCAKSGNVARTMPGPDLLYTLRSTQVSSTNFYVDPGPAGSDRNPGTLVAPFSTLQRAQTAVRAVLARNISRTGPITVFLRSGTFYLGSIGALSFGAADSGGGTDSIVTWGNDDDQAAMPSKLPSAS